MHTSSHEVSTEVLLTASDTGVGVAGGPTVVRSAEVEGLTIFQVTSADGAGEAVAGPVSGKAWMLGSRPMVERLTCCEEACR